MKFKIEYLANALQAAHASVFGSKTPPLDREGYLEMARMVAAEYAACENTAKRAEETGLE